MRLRRVGSHKRLNTQPDPRSYRPLAMTRLFILPLLAAFAMSCDAKDEASTTTTKGATVEEPTPEPDSARTASAPASDGPKTSAKEPGAPTAIVIPPPSPPSGAMPTLASVDEEVRNKAAELARERRKGRFPVEVTKPVNGPAFLALALSSNDPEELKVVFREVKMLYGPKETHYTRVVDDDYRAVILYRLASEDPVIAEAAFDASGPCIGPEPANAPVLSALVHFAFHHPSPAGRLLALRALSTRWSPTPPVEDAFLHALDDSDSAFLAQALEQVSFDFGHRFSKLDELRARIDPLLTHSDPAVRGTAVAALAETARRLDKEEAGAMLLPMLGDSHPFVRAAVLDSLATLRRESAVAVILEHVADSAPAKLRIPWTRLDGVEDRSSLLLHEDTVGLEAQRDLKRLTKKMEHPFEPSGLGSDGTDGGQARGAEEARAWFAAHKATLPPQGPDAPATG